MIQSINIRKIMSFAANSAVQWSNSDGFRGGPWKTIYNARRCLSLHSWGTVWHSLKGMVTKAGCLLVGEQWLQPAPFLRSKRLGIARAKKGIEKNRLLHVRNTSLLQFLLLSKASFVWPFSALSHLSQPSRRSASPSTCGYHPPTFLCKTSTPNENYKSFCKRMGSSA